MSPSESVENRVFILPAAMKACMADERIFDHCEGQALDMEPVSTPRIFVTPTD
jgi:hypothetical protein